MIDLDAKPIYTQGARAFLARRWAARRDQKPVPVAQIVSEPSPVLYLKVERAS